MAKLSPVTNVGNRLLIGGVPVYEGSITELARRITSKQGLTGPRLIVTPNVDQVINLDEIAEFAQAYGSADIATLDGMPLVGLSRIMGHTRLSRITGVDLMYEVARTAPSQDAQIALTGGSIETANRAASNLHEGTGASITAVAFPMITAVEDPASLEVISMLAAVRPTVVFLCLGSPKQELWFHRWKEHLPPAHYIGAGASVDFASGKVARAPRLMRTLSLEWAWRLVHEPRRLGPRYLVKGPRFINIARRTMQQSMKGQRYQQALSVEADRE